MINILGTPDLMDEHQSRLVQPVLTFLTAVLDRLTAGVETEADGQKKEKKFI